MLHHDIHEKLLAYTDRELELLRANYQLCHKFKSHMERRFFKDNYIHIEKQTRFTKIPLHSHGFIELIYIYQGKMHQKINDENLTLDSRQFPGGTVDDGVTVECASQQLSYQWELQ
ncbi:hypothetical protein KAM622c_24540 [Klebsiella quasipneumoniae subsp. quasipneumoniae]|nr:hypothetical protein KAM622c_24540 [Klebsiella quasipneumoniae subsp. quasipneumoniae]